MNEKEDRAFTRIVSALANRSTVNSMPSRNALMSSYRTESRDDKEDAVLDWASECTYQVWGDKEEAFWMLITYNYHDLLTLFSNTTLSSETSESTEKVDSELKRTLAAIELLNEFGSYKAQFLIRSLIDLEQNLNWCKKCGRLVKGATVTRCGHCWGPSCLLCGPPVPTLYTDSDFWATSVDGIECRRLKLRGHGVRLAPLSDISAQRVLVSAKQTPTKNALRTRIQGQKKYTSFVIELCLHWRRVVVDINTKDKAQAVFYYDRIYKRYIQDGQVAGDDVSNDEIQAAYEVAVSAIRLCEKPDTKGNQCNYWYNAQIGCLRHDLTVDMTKDTTKLYNLPGYAGTLGLYKITPPLNFKGGVYLKS